MPDEKDIMYIREQYKGMSQVQWIAIYITLLKVCHNTKIAVPLLVTNHIEVKVILCQNFLKALEKEPILSGRDLPFSPSLFGIDLYRWHTSMLRMQQLLGSVPI